MQLVIMILVAVVASIIGFYFGKEEGYRRRLSQEQEERTEKSLSR